jgi:hypothetical protein
MKALFAIGVVVSVLGLASFFVRIPGREQHGVQIGDASAGITFRHRDQVSPVISGVLVLAGMAMMIAGRNQKG